MPSGGDSLASSERSLTRRCLLSAVAAGTTVTLAGCSSNSTDDDDTGGEGDGDESGEVTDDSETEPDGDSEPTEPDIVIEGTDLPRETPYDVETGVTVTLANHGDIDDDVGVELDVAGETVSTTTVTVPGSSDRDAELAIPEDTVFDGDYDITITAGDDTVTTSIYVDNPNPYGTDTLTVGLEQETAARHDMEDIVTDALAYWEDNSEVYAGYPIQYDYRPNTSDPDVVIRVVDDIETCGEHSGEIAGCAPLVTSTAPDTAEIRIVDGYRKEWMTTTLKHELGHTLGLGHDDEPLHIMSNEVEDRIPDYDIRRDAVDSYSDVHEVGGPYDRGSTAWETALNAWEAGDYEQVEEYGTEAYDEWWVALSLAEDAHSAAEQLDEDEAADLLTDAVTHIELLLTAADEAVLAAIEAQQTFGDPEPHRQASNEAIADANEHTLHAPVDVFKAFGFPHRN